MQDSQISQLLLKVGEILQNNLEGIDEIQLVNGILRCQIKQPAAIIEIAIKDAASFQEAETIVE